MRVNTVVQDFLFFFTYSDSSLRGYDEKEKYPVQIVDSSDRMDASAPLKSPNIILGFVTGAASGKYLACKPSGIASERIGPVPASRRVRR